MDRCRFHLGLIWITIMLAPKRTVVRWGKGAVHPAAHNMLELCFATPISRQQRQLCGARMCWIAAVVLDSQQPGHHTAISEALLLSMQRLDCGQWLICRSALLWHQQHHATSCFGHLACLWFWQLDLGTVPTLQAAQWTTAHWQPGRVLWA